MEGRKSVSLFQKLGNYWLFVTERNPQVSEQQFVREACANSPDTLRQVWDRHGSVQIGLVDGNDWVVIGTNWMHRNGVATQGCAVDSLEHLQRILEREWERNHRVIALLYDNHSCVVLYEHLEQNGIVSQQFVQTAHWPGDEIQQIWAQGKRIQCLFSGTQDWMIIAEQLRYPAPSQAVQAGPDPDSFDFHSQLSAGYKLIGASYHELTRVFSFLWEAVTPVCEAPAQEIYFSTEFPSDQLSALGYKLENR